MIKFIYLSDVYIYERGFIYKENKLSSYNDRVCRVHDCFVETLDTLSEEQRQAVLKSVIHSYLLGCTDGRSKLIKEFKELFSITNSSIDW